MKTAAVILAAGASTRFGSPKQLARLDGRTMVETVIDVAAAAGLVPLIAVVPSELTLPESVVRAVNDEPAAGMSRSLRLGLAAIPADVDAAMILLGDQPGIRVEVLRSLLRKATRTDRPVVAACAEGRMGPPVLLRRPAFGLAVEVTGDAGLRRILETHPEMVCAVEVGEHAPDVDTPADLAALQHGR